MNNLLPQLKGLNLWTLKQKIKDHTIQKTSTIQLLQKIDTYRFPNPKDLTWLTLLGYQAPHNPNIRFHSDKNRQQKHIAKHAVLQRLTGEMKSHSYVKQYLQLFEACAAHTYADAADAVSILDTSNTAKTMYAATSGTGIGSMYHWALESPSANTNYGILVGTGVTAPATGDYTIETLVANGTGVGQLSYQPTAVGAAGVVGANVDLVVTRVFVNSSGGSITLREICLVCGHATPVATTAYYFLLAHDAVNQAIANSEVAVVGYIMRTTV